MGLLAVVAMAAAPSFVAIKSGVGKTVAEIAALDIRNTQKSAMIRHEIRSIRFLGGNRYIYDMAATGKGSPRDISAISSTAVFVNPAVIAFNAVGEPIGATLPIVVTDGDDIYKIAVEPVTGKVTIR